MTPIPLEARLHQLLTEICQSSLTAQTLDKVGVTLDDLTAEERDAAIDLAHQLLATGGISAALVTEHLLAGLSFIYSSPENVEVLCNQLAGMLWSILGDPKSGPPPAIYFKASIAMHLFFLGLIKPPTPQSSPS